MHGPMNVKASHYGLNRNFPILSVQTSNKVPIKYIHLSQFLGIKCEVIPVLNSASRHEDV